ncbi:MAG: hypothetical protein LAP85_20805 [Acidobacteriia bacterium]|nr:hypothetical protein [Terriglobia bacterium]
MTMNVEASDQNSNQAFQQCGSCGQLWNQWPDFILDRGVRLLGFQAIAGLPDANLLVFEHRCGGSVSVLAKRLRHMLPDSEQSANMPSLFGTEMCNQHCRSLENLEACDRPCVNARDRRLILVLLEMKREIR